MSAIDTTFHWVRNPTAINGLATTYVSKRGSDVSGNGTAQNPYSSLSKATAVATNNTNIMLDDGKWDEARTSDNRYFYWWGNGFSIITGITFLMYPKDSFYFLSIINYINTPPTYWGNYNEISRFQNCFLYNAKQTCARDFYNCILIDCERDFSGQYGRFIRCYNSVVVYSSINTITITTYYAKDSLYFYNCILYNIIFGKDFMLVNNNYTNQNISYGINCINNATTGQTFADYFNYVHHNVLANPNSASIEDWIQCDFTAKAGSKNIGAGEKGTTIGFNQGLSMYADNSANDVFSPSNGATLKNIAWDSNLNGYTLVQKERICQGATANTITLDSSASAVDDYYNNLFIGIVAGDGYGELFLITDYDGATKTATIYGTWATTPNTNSIYTISGTILSAVKDLGKAIKVKRNWTFADNFTALQDGQWAEFMTHVETNSKQFPTSCYSYEYSTDGVNFVQGQTADDLVSATNGENKVTANIYGDCSPNYDEATAKNLIMRYIRVRVHIGFNIGQLGE